MIVTADHGNIDTMLDDGNHPVTTHSLAKVPFIIVDHSIENESGRGFNEYCSDDFRIYGYC